MTTSEWSDANAMPMPASVTSHDLFGGDLFGDELMDIYNSAAVIEDGSTEVVTSGIPSLPALPETTQEAPVIHGGHSTNHPGAQVVITAVAMDDGLGAFRPSTSFNDLTALLNPTETMEQQAIVAPPRLASNPGTDRTTGVETVKKRGIPVQEGPPSKKRTTQKSRANTSASKRTISTAKVKSMTLSATTSPSAGQAALKLRQEATAKTSRAAKNNDTPNPLTMDVNPTLKSLNASTPPSFKAKSPTAASFPAPICVKERNVASPKAGSISSEAAAATAAAAPPVTPSAGLTTEADFKSVAQAAVTNLILNVGTTKPDITPVGGGIDETTGFPKKVDTSTAHIKALTSSNWVAACGGGSVDGSAAALAAVAAVAADSKANNRARRQNLTPDERARQNRDRNREHARNTRLRKKAYVEELKRTLTELVAQRDVAELEKRHSAQRELEQKEVRFRVMEEFLKLRGRNEVNFARWVAILEDGFTLTLPLTDFGSPAQHDNKNQSVDVASVAFSNQVLNGPTEVMSDSCNLSTLLQTLGNGSGMDPTSKSSVVLLYHCGRKHFFMDGANAVLEWTVTSVGAINQGATKELTIKGTMHALFSPASNKLLSAKILFDTGVFIAQLQHLTVSKSTESEEKNIDSYEAVAAAAAQTAANEADALLDSIQMPQLSAAVPSAITVVPSSTTVSVTSSDKGDSDSEDSVDDALMKQDVSLNTCAIMATRRSIRLKE